MGKVKNLKTLAPHLSILTIIFSLFTFVFLQMEERRLGYELLQLGKDRRKIREMKKQKEMVFAHLTRPQNIEKMATMKGELRKMRPHQLIHLSGIPTNSTKTRETP